MLPKRKGLDMILFLGYCSELLQMLIIVLQTTEVGDSVFRDASDFVRTRTRYKVFYLHPSQRISLRYLSWVRKPREKHRKPMLQRAICSFWKGASLPLASLWKIVGQDFTSILKWINVSLSCIHVSVLIAYISELHLKIYLFRECFFTMRTCW